jgi:ATP-binding cassette subfamily C protein
MSLPGKRLQLAVELLRTRQRLTFVWLIAARIIVGFCDLLLAGAMYLLFLLLQGGRPSHHPWWTPKTTLTAALLTSAFVILRVLLDLLSTRSVVAHIQSLYTDFLLRLTDGYSRMRWERFVQRNRSELLKHATHTAREAATFYHLYVETIAAVAVVAVMTAALVYQSPTVACGLGFTVLLFYGVHRFLLRKKLQGASWKREQSLHALQRSLTDMFSSGKETRAHGNSSFFQDRIRSQMGDLTTSNVRLSLLPQIARILADQGVVLLFLFVVIAVQLRHGDARHLLSLLAFYFVLSRRLLPLISQISMMTGQMESGYENLRMLHDELGECLTHRALAPPTQAPSAEFLVELDEVSFFFDEGTPILQNVNLRLRRGESIVLRGPSGSGKSTLLNLIAGVVHPVTGTVRVDRAAIAYVPQEIVLLDDSIRNNLLFGLPKRSDAQLMCALAAAQLKEFVLEQPRGLATHVGDNGILLSGGQRQRLGLARAILRDVPVLLLDEATSALDEENERLILHHLNSSGMSVLLVTHRIHAETFAQRAFQLQDGRLIEESKDASPVADVPALAAALAR